MSQSAVFAAIAAPSRREIMAMLTNGERPVSELANSFDMSISAVSQHLTILREAGLVCQRREGRQRFYRLVPGPLQLIAQWLEIYEPFWTGRLEQLGQFLEENP